MSHISTDILEVYNTYFQKPYVIADEWNGMSADNATITNDVTSQGIPIRKLEALAGSKGVEVYLPVELTNKAGDYSLTINCATIRVTFKNTIIRTSVSERQGTIKEQFNAGDYVFTIKGVLISKDRTLPDADILKLKNMALNQSTIYLNNAYAELFMPGENRIAIESLEFPEQEGKHIRHRPFVLVCETDYIDTLILK